MLILQEGLHMQIEARQRLRSQEKVKTETMMSVREREKKQAGLLEESTAEKERASLTI